MKALREQSTLVKIMLVVAAVWAVMTLFVVGTKLLSSGGDPGDYDTGGGSASSSQAEVQPG